MKNGMHQEKITNKQINKINYLTLNLSLLNICHINTIISYNLLLMIQIWHLYKPLFLKYYHLSSNQTSMETRYERKGLEIKSLPSYTLLELDNPYYVCISRSLLFCTCAIFNGSHYQVTWETNFFLCVLLCSVTNNKVSCTNICIAVQRWYVPDYEMHDTVTTLHITYLHIHVYCSMWQRYY